MNLRAALAFLVLGFVGLLLVLGAASFLKWLKAAYPRQFPALVVGLCLAVAGLAVWGYREASDRPVFHENDLLTLQEPVVAHVTAVDRARPTIACIVDRYEHLAVVDVGSTTLKARVESNKTSEASYCPTGVDVQVEQAWLHRYTLTHRHP